MGSKTTQDSLTVGRRQAAHPSEGKPERASKTLLEAREEAVLSYIVAKKL